MKYLLVSLITILSLSIIGVVIFFTATPSGKAIWNNYMESIQKVDDETNYVTKKEVEDTCRSMIASYITDKLTYEQYKDSESELERSWASAAKVRANQTASTYNNYILKNSYVWEDNIPEDIYTNLPYLE